MIYSIKYIINIIYNIMHNCIYIRICEHTQKMCTVKFTTQKAPDLPGLQMSRTEGLGAGRLPEKGVAGDLPKT